MLENARADASARGGGDAAAARYPWSKRNGGDRLHKFRRSISARDFRVIELRHDAAVRALISPAAATRDADDAPRVYI